MPKINLQFKTDFKKILNPLKNFLVKVPWIVARKSFALFWGALIVIILIDALIFYQYLWKVDVRKINIESKQISIDESSYNSFLGNYASRKAIYNKGKIEIHNIFFR
ncbi:MAG: hypothetical protein PHV47_01955 [Candidatus Pacebacteria bacterium]|nr:hypothetical protein [Candidatus Paceibacterota bacterium]